MALLLVPSLARAAQLGQQPQAPSALEQPLAVAAGTDDSGSQPQDQGVRPPGGADAGIAAGPASPDPLPLENPFGLQLRPPTNLAEQRHQLHCDVLRHLKVPITNRRLDSYMRPAFILPAKNAEGKRDRVQLLGDLGGERERLYEAGFDIYGCTALDFAVDLQSNTQSGNRVVTGPGELHNWQGNLNQLIGVDFYSRLVSKNWKGGQLHLSFAWPEPLNGGPLYNYGNAINPGWYQARQYNGYFYTDVGGERSQNSQYQGFRLFEYWLQQTYGKGGESWIRIGAINPWITFNTSILSGLFGSWSFDEPGLIGTTPGLQNGPLLVAPPPGLSIQHELNDRMVAKLQVNSGYWDPSGGLWNRRGINQYWDLSNYGLEFIYELTYKGGTYSGNPADFGQPWFVRIGGQNHTGQGTNNYLATDGQPYLQTSAPQATYRGNSQYYAMVEAMLYREKGNYNRGLTGFLKLKYSPWEYKGTITRFWALGFGYEGIFKRDRDVVFAGVSRSYLNSGTNQLLAISPSCQQVSNCGVTGSEGVVEVGYSAQITDYFTVTPKIFWVLSPAGISAFGDIVSFGVEFRASF